MAKCNLVTLGKLVIDLINKLQVMNAWRSDIIEVKNMLLRLHLISFKAQNMPTEKFPQNISDSEIRNK